MKTQRKKINRYYFWFLTVIGFIYGLFKYRKWYHKYAKDLDNPCYQCDYVGFMTTVRKSRNFGEILAWDFLCSGTICLDWWKIVYVEFAPELKPE